MAHVRDESDTAPAPTPVLAKLSARLVSSPLVARFGLLIIVWASLAVRTHLLVAQVPRWDEGWSLAHASLPWPELWSIATQEWHPPLYVALLKLWLVFGKSLWSVRTLSVFGGVLAVPLFAQVAREWIGVEHRDRQLVGLLAAGYAATWPLLVYYGQVARMYVLLPVPVLVATWSALRMDRDETCRPEAGLALGTLAAMYTHYYAIWPLLVVWVNAAWRHPRRLSRLALAGAAVVAAYLPWLLAARSMLQVRVTSGATAGSDPVAGTVAFLKPTLQGLTFAYSTDWRSAGVLAAVIALGAALGKWNTRQVGQVALPLLAMCLTVLGTAFGAQAARFFAVRHLVPASLFLGLLLVWALARLRALWWPLLLVALVLLGIAYWPTSSCFVYAKTLEVVDPFDPSADHRYLSGRAGVGDLVFFNVLARAGWYEYERDTLDAAWSYAMRWDPIIEPIERIAERIRSAARTRSRLWFVLYKGSYGPNAALTDWLAATLYPAGGEWREDVLYLAYVAPQGAWREGPHDLRFGASPRLVASRMNWNASGDGSCAIELMWATDGQLGSDLKVFVHLVDESGQLLAQHDAPLGGQLPASTWTVGEPVLERHGLLLPSSSLRRQMCRILLGVYNGTTGQRLLLNDGRDHLVLAEVLLDR